MTSFTQSKGILRPATVGFKISFNAVLPERSFKHTYPILRALFWGVMPRQWAVYLDFQSQLARRLCTHREEVVKQIPYLTIIHYLLIFSGGWKLFLGIIYDTMGARGVRHAVFFTTLYKRGRVHTLRFRRHRFVPPSTFDSGRAYQEYNRGCCDPRVCTLSIL